MRRWCGIVERHLTPWPRRLLADSAEGEERRQLQRVIATLSRTACKRCEIPPARGSASAVAPSTPSATRPPVATVWPTTSAPLAARGKRQRGSWPRSSPSRTKRRGSDKIKRTDGIGKAERLCESSRSGWSCPRTPVPRVPRAPSGWAGKREEHRKARGEHGNLTRLPSRRRSGRSGGRSRG